ncbi:translesion DNA synthesis-associated protein ImuA [uncultured Oxalicibacterium sp.]|uniref:translesion DNA synthesis-associated protein ImuA n=1 Tax=uncultured Oxalicibacterium sp. TaxID=1168540 RepID=UPI0025F4441A|nr:translesion DNA synthesis-associated protein ImuA [uncultured Oxalicibacterium sp.]
MSLASFSSHSPHPSLLNTLPEHVWRGDQMGSHAARPVTSGHRALDRELPNGGWPSSVLIELLMRHPGIGELRLLAPTLSQLTKAGKTVVLMAPPHIPFAAALAELGLDLQHVLLIEADKPADRMWAVEQALKSDCFGALLCWLPQARADQLRRLQLAAAGSEGLAFVFRPLIAREQSSPAPLRMVCQPAPAGSMSVEIIKRRGPVHAAPIILPLTVPEILIKPFNSRTMVDSTLSFPRHAMDRFTSAAATARSHSALAA